MGINYDYEEELMIKIVWYYYIENLTQKEIAKLLGINRIKILRLLDKAKENGLISFQIRSGNAKRLTIESKFKEIFGLKDVLIIPPASSGEILNESLAHAASMYVNQHIQENSYINMGYGDTPSRILNHLAQRAENAINVVSLTGGVNYYLPDARSGVFNAHLHLIPSPLILSSSNLIEELKKEAAVTRIFKMAALSDFTIVGIGGINTDATIVKNGVLTKDDYLILKKKGAVGDILSHFIDINGNLVDTDLENRLMSPALCDIEKYNNVIGVAGGLHKIKAIYAVLTGKYLDILITDETTAAAVLELHQKNSHK
jgi:DNA-binding transcriptional regulator LsrR (DeoR family)